jgi:hypothetical protein
MRHPGLIATVALLGLACGTGAPDPSASGPDPVTATGSPQRTRLLGANAKPALRVTEMTPQAPSLPAVPDFVNAVGTSSYAGLYRSGSGDRISIWNGGDTLADVQALDERGAVLWTHTLGVGNLKSGFDFNGDGVIDFALVKRATLGSCNADVLYRRTVEIYSGLDASLLTSTALDDRCILINGVTWQASITLAENTIQFGTPAGVVAIAPRYYGQGWFSGPGFSDAFYSPDAAAYDTYENSQPALQPSAGGAHHVDMSQPPHGLIVPFGTGARYVAFSSGRVVQYAIAPLSPAQLLVDTPFLSSTDLVGRSYGLVQHDAQGNPNRVSVISGTSIHDLLLDVEADDASGVVTGHDLWGGIERHVTTYNLTTGAIDQHAISYAHTNSNQGTYVNRVAFPANAYLPSSSALGSRLVYNVFDGATWSIHISTPGGSASQTIWANQIVWDVIPRGPDAVDLITSPVDSRSIQVPNFVSDASVVQSWRAATYFPKWRTEVYRWTRSGETAALVRTLDGAIPSLEVPISSPGSAASADGLIFPVLRAMDRATRSMPVMVMRARRHVLRDTHRLVGVAGDRGRWQPRGTVVPP